MTSSVPLRAYHQPTLSGDYADSITDVPLNRGSQLHDEREYDPYMSTHPAQELPWSKTAFAGLETDEMHKPSLSYGSKELGKWP